MKEEINKIVEFIREEVRITPMTKAVIGISGGIDSAVAAALTVKALGKENVIGVILPCFSSPESEKDGLEIIQHLDIQYSRIDLQPPFVGMLKTLDGNVSPDASNINTIIGNIKARLRMTTLYAVAQANDAIVMGTTNKTEHLIGYYTKYGDGGVDLEPLQQFYKTEVKEMAKELGLPDFIVTKAPTADLGITKTDEDEFTTMFGRPVTYEELDKHLKAYETGEGIDDIDKKLLGKILEVMKHTEHKRILPNCLERDL